MVYLDDFKMNELTCRKRLLKGPDFFFVKRKGTETPIPAFTPQSPIVLDTAFMRVFMLA